ncbi:MAG: neutral/alkaline non-lysosomal ceramidase N-terminal domain-containing protein [Candidatus Polarisedimenticolaceae bacterium]|nr:neutral/alkaline non-lysosomal ceramidase N-terminal domain-containing protein [Candidatus Polarisedimenticolaceae bacterium]
MSRLRQFTLWFGIVVALLWLVAGPRPADNAPPEGSDYQATTLQRLLEIPSSLVEGQLQIGLAETDITPPIGHPLAGYGARRPKSSDAIDRPIFARALTLSVAGRQVTLLTAEILLINQKMAKLLYQRTGLAPDQLFITSSHTHSGPGGWGDSLVERLILGDFDADYFDLLANQLTATIQRSQQHMQPVELALLQIDMRDSQHNRFDYDQPTNDRRTAMLFRQAGSRADAPPSVIFTIFGAHPTILSLKTHKLSGDYPAYLTSNLKRLSGAEMVLFASGSVGDSKPIKPEGRDAFERAANYGRTLAERLAAEIPQAEYRQKVVLGSLHLSVDMPPIRHPISQEWTLGPLVSGLFGDDLSTLKALRIGPLLLFGFPGDYAGHLATQLSEAIRQQSQQSLLTATTSFNGDFDGYLISHQWFESLDRTESRGLNFFGPWGGEYLNMLALKMAAYLGAY